MHLCRHLFDPDGDKLRVRSLLYSPRKVKYDPGGGIFWNCDRRFLFGVRALGSRYVGLNRVTNIRKGKVSTLIYYKVSTI